MPVVAGRIWGRTENSVCCARQAREEHVGTLSVNAEGLEGSDVPFIRPSLCPVPVCPHRKHTCVVSVPPSETEDGHSPCLEGCVTSN